jgi:ABC-type transport system substrate-binding protein
MRALLRPGALCLLTVAAGPGPALAQSPGELRVALPWTPENLDPTMNLSSIRAKVGVSIFDSLVGRDADNRIVPQLAESWKALDDLTLQLKLRRGIVFHNGEPFNAGAVRFTFERVLDPNQKSPNRDPARRKKIYADLARAMVEDATWVFLMQQVGIYATRDRVTWTPRGDQWMLLHEATLQ